MRQHDLELGRTDVPTLEEGESRPIAGGECPRGDDMPFIQIIDFTTSRFEEGDKLVQQYRADVGDRGKGRRGTVCKDRDKENHYVSIIEFDSYEDAMENSELPETKALAERLATLADAPPKFLNLEVVRTEES
jgi:hypothetical protein